MRTFTKIFILAGMILIFYVSYKAAVIGYGYGTVRNAAVINTLNKDCPPHLRDRFGNCKDRSYRSSYYGYYIMGSSTRGRSGGK
jgi:hypothetical protein